MNKSNDNSGSILNMLLSNKKTREIIMYLIVGGSTTIISWVTYAIAESSLSCGGTISNFIKTLTRLEISGLSIEIFLAGIISWVISVTFAFITNKIFVFESKNWKLGYTINELILFVSSRVATGILEIIGVPLLVALGLNQTIFDIEGAVSKVFVSIIVVIANYILSKFFVFNRKEEDNIFKKGNVLDYDTPTNAKEAKEAKRNIELAKKELEDQQDELKEAKKEAEKDSKEMEKDIKKAEKRIKETEKDIKEAERNLKKAEKDIKKDKKN